MKDKIEIWITRKKKTGIEFERKVDMGEKIDKNFKSRLIIFFKKKNHENK